MIKSDMKQWGVYCNKPSYEEPHGDLHIEWVYIVDLDNLCFITRSGSGWSREFKLENLPRHLFELKLYNQELLSMPVSLEQLYNATPAITYNPTDLARFGAFAPRLSTVQVAEGSFFDAGVILDPWKPLSQLLLEKFLERYIAVFKDLASPKNLAIFASTGLDGKTAAANKFKQLAYGIVNLCDAVGRIKFRKARHVSYHTDTPPTTPPAWECPESNTLWIGDVLVILEARITTSEFLHAAIGRSIDLVRRSHATARSTHGTAIIFSIQALVIVDIPYADASPHITYSQPLPVITPSDCRWYRCFGGLRAEPTAGLAALIDVFARHRAAYSLPAGLPLEICARVAQLCGFATRGSLAASCRAFAAVVAAYPRIDDWDLLHAWNHGNVGFVARRGPGLTRSVVSLEDAAHGYGYEVGLFRGHHRIELDLPCLVAVRRHQEGVAGCACCAGLPVLGEAPVMVGRTIHIPEDRR